MGEREYSEALISADKKKKSQFTQLRVASVTSRRVVAAQDLPP